MDPIEVARIASPEEPSAGPVPKPASALPVTQSISIPIILLVLALGTVGGGGALVRHFGGTIYPVAYAAAVLAALSLPLLLAGGWRRRRLGVSRLLLGRSIEQWSFFAVFAWRAEDAVSEFRRPRPH